MESTIKKNENLGPKYPYLGVFLNEKDSNIEEAVILFTSKGTGVCIYTSGNVYGTLGEYSTSWAEAHFKPFTGEITLKG